MKRQNEYIIIWAMFWLFTAAMCLVIGVGKCSGQDASVKIGTTPPQGLTYSGTGNPITIYGTGTGNLYLDTRKTGMDSKVPEWVYVGIAMVESSSYWSDHTLIYVDQEDGDAGEHGPFQLCPALFDEVALPGESFDRLRTDTLLATKVFERCMLSLYQRTGSWSKAVGAYHAGIHGKARRKALYLAAVKEAWRDSE